MMTKEDTAVREGASAVMVRCGCSQSVLQHDIAGAHRQLAVYASTACLYLLSSKTTRIGMIIGHDLLQTSHTGALVALHRPTD